MLNDFRQCIWCGSIFRYLGNPTCSKCVQKMDADFLIVREYIYKHRHATVPDVVEDTGVSEKEVLHFLRDGRIEMTEADGSLKCESCGEAIKSGRLCASCKNSMASTLSGSIPKPKAPIEKKKSVSKTEGNKMHRGVTSD